MPSKRSILIIHLDFPRWKVAKSWSYEAQLGFNEGLDACGSNVFSLMNLYAQGSHLHKCWFRSIKEFVGTQKFDQVWAEVVHSEYTEEYLNFMVGLAPIRLAMIGESLLYGEEERRYLPSLETRCEEVKKRLAYFTHTLCVDEKDVKLTEADCGVHALWWVLGLPEWSIAKSIENPMYDKAGFSGPVYGARSGFLQDLELSRFMLHLPPLEKRSSYPFLFDVTQRLHVLSLGASPSLAAYSNRHYISAIRHIRQRLFHSWLVGLKRGIAVVQLPHFVKAFPGRIYEGMAAGRPVITMALKDRPQAMRLFEPGKEILYYENAPEELIELIKMLQKDSGYARNIAENAVKKMRNLHTIEIRVKQILDWIESGDLPGYQ
jgi:hypothetical protein